MSVLEQQLGVGSSCPRPAFVTVRRSTVHRSQPSASFKAPLCVRTLDRALKDMEEQLQQERIRAYCSRNFLFRRLGIEDYWGGAVAQLKLWGPSPLGDDKAELKAWVFLHEELIFKGMKVGSRALWCRGCGMAHAMAHPCDRYCGCSASPVMHRPCPSPRCSAVRLHGWLHVWLHGWLHGWFPRWLLHDGSSMGGPKSAGPPVAVGLEVFGCGERWKVNTCACKHKARSATYRGQHEHANMLRIASKRLNDAAGSAAIERGHGPCMNPYRHHSHT